LTHLVKQLDRRQARLSLSDRSVSTWLGIFNAYFSYLKRGKRQVSPALRARLSSLLVTKTGLAVEVLPRKYALVYVEEETGAAGASVCELVERLLIAKQVEGCAATTIKFYRENLERFHTSLPFWSNVLPVQL